MGGQFSSKKVWYNTFLHNVWVQSANYSRGAAWAGPSCSFTFSFWTSRASASTVVGIPSPWAVNGKLCLSGASVPSTTSTPAARCLCSWPPQRLVGTLAQPDNWRNLRNKVVMTPQLHRDLYVFRDSILKNKKCMSDKKILYFRQKHAIPKAQSQAGWPRPPASVRVDS